MPRGSWYIGCQRRKDHSSQILVRIVVANPNVSSSILFVVRDGCLLLDTLDTVLASHRAVIDHLCRERRRSQRRHNSRDCGSGSRQSSWSDASASYQSEDEVDSETAADDDGGDDNDNLHEESGEFLSLWSSRFVFITEQLTTGITNLMSAASTLSVGIA